jgi:hypothetical protein
MDWVFQRVSGSEETLHASSIANSNDDTDHDEQIDIESPSMDNNSTAADDVPSSQYTDEERRAMDKAASTTDSDDDTEQIDMETDDEQIDIESPSMDKSSTAADDVPSSQYTDEERRAMDNPVFSDSSDAIDDAPTDTDGVPMDEERFAMDQPVLTDSNEAIALTQHTLLNNTSVDESAATFHPALVQLYNDLKKLYKVLKTNAPNSANALLPEDPLTVD